MEKRVRAQLEPESTLFSGIPRAGCARMKETLFQRIGGSEGVASLVVDFYKRVLDDPELAPFFDGVPLDKLQSMQRALFSAALDGPLAYTGQPLGSAHDGRGITPHHLQLFLEHLFLTVRELDLTQGEIIEIIDRINLYADEVTNASGFAG